MLPRNCTNRKHEYRIHEPLSNKQWLNLYFRKHCNSKGISVWTTALCISKTVRDANEWYTSLRKGYRKLNSKTTGTCGLEGLLKALEYIVGFRDNMKEKEEIHIEWADKRRKNVYSRLLKYDFFYDDDPPCYFGRNMKFWERKTETTNKLIST